MTKAAVKERDEPALPLDGMKDVTPKAKTVGGHQPAKSTTNPKNLPSGGSSGKAVAVAKPQRAPTKPANAPTNLIAAIANAASDPKCDPAKMAALYAIHKEMSQDQAKIDFIRDFAALQGENLHINAKGRIIIPAKDGKKEQNTPYAKFNDIAEAIKPLLQKHGFTLSFPTEPSPAGDRLIIKGLLAHKGGHERTTAFPLPAEVSGSKNNVQGWGSSFSYGKRYCTIALLNITSSVMKDQDTDGIPPKTEKASGAQRAGTEAERESKVETGPVRVTQAQADRIIEAIEDCGVKRETFLKHFKVAKVTDLPVASYKDALDACADFKAKRIEKESK